MAIDLSPYRRQEMTCWDKVRLKCCKKKKKPVVVYPSVSIAVRRVDAFSVQSFSEIKEREKI